MKFFKTENEAIDYAEFFNRCLTSKAKPKHWKVVVDGPENNFCVMSLQQASEDEFLYKIYF